MDQCTHRRSVGDPHPLCETCTVEQGFPLCEISSTCEFCGELTMDVWKRIMDARRKRQSRADRAAIIPVSISIASDTDPEICDHTSPPQLSPERDNSQVTCDQALDMLQTQRIIGTVQDTAGDTDGAYEDVTDSDTSHVDEDMVAPYQVVSPPVTPASEPSVFESGQVGMSLFDINPEDVEIPDFLRYVGDKTEFEVGSPVNSRNTAPLRLESQRPAPSRADDFLCLSTSTAIPRHTHFRMAEAVKMANSEVPGKFPPPQTSKGSMRVYQTLDRTVNASAMLWSHEKPKWFPDMRASSKVSIRDEDCARFENWSREMLVICSSMDAFLSAAIKGIDEHVQSDPVTNKIHPCIHRALSGVANGLFDLISRATMVLHQSVCHRRDAAYSSMKLSAKHVRTLRYAPYLGELYTFPQEVVDAVTVAVQQQHRDDAFQRVATTSSTHRSSKPASATKRLFSSPQQSTPAKRKVSPAVSFAPSTKPAVTPTKTKPHM